MKKLLPTLLTAALLLLTANSHAADPVTLTFLDKSPPPTAIGTTWGVPFPQGTVKKTDAFTLKSGDKFLSLQSWPLGYWPDGSIKWTGLATIADPSLTGPLQLTATDGPPLALNTTIQVSNADTITINTGPLIARIPKSGNILIDSLTVDGREVARRGTLQLHLQNGPDDNPLAPAARAAFQSKINSVTIEQTGLLRTVVKIDGVHKQLPPITLNGRLDAQPSTEKFPFSIRLYFYAGQSSIRVVNTLIYDGNPETDFIRGLGISFDVPMREQFQNRHVRFANSNGGVFAEPVQLGTGRGGGRGGTPAGSPLDGARQPNTPTPNPSARWDSFKLTQLSANGFNITKRTNPKSTYINVGEGQRASGFAFIGDASGGLGVGVKDFWQSYPAAIEIHDTLADTAKLHVWLWSPDGPAMDMRHYDIRDHGNVNSSGSYEDWESGFDTPTGIARTSEMTLFATANTPSRQETANLAQITTSTPLLTVSPQYMHSTGVFGVWSLPDRSTPFKKQVEDRLDGAVAFYKNAINEHNWYGFWHYGDVMHAYDAARHKWRYDVGGYAWDNTELGTVLWLWYSYLRTGDAGTFRMAEAMIRHTAEVDSYHLGKFKGLGSRHNVIHWGDSAKEARVSQAAHSMFYYFLTGDERTGDLITEVASADETAAKLDPMRKAKPITEAEKQYPGRIRIGPDWLALAGNWMVEWERTGDKKWRDKIMAGVDSMYDMPFWMRTGDRLTVGYDYNTGKMFALDSTPGQYNLTTIQGGGEVAMALEPLLNEPKFSKMWSQYTRLGSANAATLTRDKETGNEGATATMLGEQGGMNAQGVPRLAAWAYKVTRNPAFAQVAMRAFQGNANQYNPTKIEGPESLNPVHEAPGVTNGGTNSVAQYSLMMIQVLELCKDQLPTDPLPAPPGRGGRGQ